ENLVLQRHFCLPPQGGQRLSRAAADAGHLDALLHRLPERSRPLPIRPARHKIRCADLATDAAGAPACPKGQETFYPMKPQHPPTGRRAGFFIPALLLTAALLVPLSPAGAQPQTLLVKMAAPL